jgi:spermidine/putrescine transport system ATP-binding protein
MLEVQELWKGYEGAPLLCGVSFRVERGETVCLLGPSGSGKSTILRIVAGFEGSESGHVLWDGLDLAGMPVHRRNFGLMFQEYALFPHLNVAQNIAFGLRMHGLPQEMIGQRVIGALKQVNMETFTQRRVTDLSGGEQQRVALARALAPQPRLLMLDEPLGALDRALREQLMEELRRILNEMQIPAIYVTHDQEEALTVADRLLLLHEGRIVQDDHPAHIYSRPANTWVAQFLGLGNILPGRVVQIDPYLVQTEVGKFQVICLPDDHSRNALEQGKEVALLLRPESARLSDPVSSDTNQIKGMVADVIFRGQGFRVSLQVGSPGQASGTNHEFRFLLDHAPQRGEPLTLYFPPEEIHCLG